MKALNFNKDTNVPNVFPLHEDRKEAIRGNLQPTQKILLHQKNTYSVSLDEQAPLEELSVSKYLNKPPNIPSTPNKGSVDFFEEVSELRKEFQEQIQEQQLQEQLQEQLQQNVLDQVENETGLVIQNWETELNTIIETNENLTMQSRMEALMLERRHPDLNQYLEQQLNQSGLSGPLEALEPVEVQVIHPHSIHPYSIHPAPVTKDTIKLANDSGNSGGNANNGDWDAFGADGADNSAVFFILLLFVLWIANLVINFLLYKAQQALKNLYIYLNTLTPNDPKNNLKNFYSIFLKCLTIFMALLGSPEAFALTFRALGGPRVQNLLRILSFLFRGAVAASLFLGGIPFFINWYQHLMQFISPVLNKTIQILAEASGPQKVTLSILFIEKTLKCILASLCYGGVCVFIRHAKNSNKQISTNKFQSILLILGFSYGVYFVLADFIYIRQLATKIAAHDLITPLVMNQLGRRSIVIGSLLFIRQFSFLPGTQVIFVILLYGFGVYSLAFSASLN